MMYELIPPIVPTIRMVALPDLEQLFVPTSPAPRTSHVDPLAELQQFKIFVYSGLSRPIRAVMFPNGLVPRSTH